MHPCFRLRKAAALTQTPYYSVTPPLGWSVRSGLNYINSEKLRPLAGAIAGRLLLRTSHLFLLRASLRSARGLSVPSLEDRPIARHSISSSTTGTTVGITPGRVYLLWHDVHRTPRLYPQTQLEFQLNGHLYWMVAPTIFPCVLQSICL